jgi:integrase/recombinase XerD
MAHAAAMLWKTCGGCVMSKVRTSRSIVRIVDPDPTRIASAAGEEAWAASNSAPLGAAYDGFALYNRAARLSGKTLEFYRCQLTPFLEWCYEHGAYSVSAITPGLIRGYLVDRQDRRLSDYSVHAAARAIRVFLNFCVREEYIKVSPMSKVAMPRINRRVLPAFTAQQVHWLLSACETDRERSIVLCLLDTGCRASEFINLNGGDVDIDTGEVQIRQGKGRKDRTVFLGQKARASLLAYYDERGVPEQDRPVWLNQALGTRLTASGLHQLLKRIGARAGIANCAPHTFRRTFAVSCLRNGMDIFRLARLMGHSDISVLRQYLDWLKDDLRAAHAQYGIVDHLF